MNFKTTLSYFCLFCCCFSNAQLLDDVANDSLVRIPEYLASERLKENIYIHTDKDIYEAGEDLWFKAYLLNGTDLKLSTDTKIIFAALINEKDDYIILREKYEASNGFAHGHLFLSETLEVGSYRLVIHTKNTLESTTNTILAVKRFQLKESIIPSILMDTEFSKRIYARNEAVNATIAVFSRSRVPFRNTTVVAQLYTGKKRLARTRVKTDINGEVALNFPAEKSEKADFITLRVRHEGKEVNHRIEIPFKNIGDIQFGMYPEGGSLVENLPSHVAFKAVDANGRPVQVKGDLYENGKKISSFSAKHAGMGMFDITPKTNQKYTVQLTSPKIERIFELPTILPEGITLKVDRSNEKFAHFSVFRSKNIPPKKVYIRAQNRGLVYWMATASLEKERIRFKLPMDKFPQGIAEVTVFDENYQPLAERLIYTNIDKKLTLTLKEISRSSFVQKDKVTMKFEVKDENENPAVANFSMSVHDHLYADTANDYGMMSHYYLFSELKGHVYDANYYFNPKNKNSAKHLDLLMLTQGWRNYVWNKKQLPFSEKKITFNTVIKGKVFTRLENKRLLRAPNKAIKVAYPTVVNAVQVDSLGNFELPIFAYNLSKGAAMILFPFENNKNTIIEVYDPFVKIDKITKDQLQFFPANDIPLYTKKQSSYNSKFSFTETNYLEEVNLSTFNRRKRKLGAYGRFIPNSDDYVCFQFNILNCVNHPSGPKPVDGETYRLNDGRTIVYDSNSESKNQNNERFVKIRGMYPEKEFYSPVYDTKEEKMFPDNRKTLFWAPNLISNEKGEITVTFYTSDVQTTFLGKIEGTNGNGLLGTHLFQFDVH
ncbi:MAG: hypothetical protein AB8B65_13420 [Kordia sp.]|uniref:hypothetical protein n=1 Tax=Kordia sp. TaxID=1965332 RepID=UPI00385C4659